MQTKDRFSLASAVMAMMTATGYGCIWLGSINGLVSSRSASRCVKHFMTVQKNSLYHTSTDMYCNLG